MISVTGSWRLVLLNGLAYHRHHLVASLIALTGIAAGVACIVAIHQTTEGAISSFASTVESISGRAALEILAPSGELDEMVHEGLRPLMREYRVRAVLEKRARVRRADAPGGPMAATEGRAVTVLGLDLVSEAAELRGREARGGTEPRAGGIAGGLEDIAGPGSILVTPDLIEGSTDPGPLEIRMGSLVRRFDKVHLLPADVADRLGLSSLAIQDIAAFQDRWERTGRLDRIELVPKNGVTSITGLEERARALVPPGLKLRRPDEKTVQLRGLLSSYRFNLHALAFMALLVGAFFIHNNMAIAVLRRRTEIGLLRALGATRGQILGTFLGESALLAAMAWLPGMLGGLVVARLAERSVEKTIAALYQPGLESRLPDPSLALAGGTLLLSVIVALLATAGPAIHAARLDPSRALLSFIPPEAGRAGTVRETAAAIFLILVALVGIQLPAPGNLPWFGFLATLCLLGAGIALLPLCFRIVGGPLASLAPPRFPSIGLSLSFLSAHPARTAAATGSLVAAVALVSSMDIMITSFRQTVVDWLGFVLVTDIVVRPDPPVAEGIGGVPPEMLAASAKIPGIVRVIPVTVMDLEYQGRLVRMVVNEQAAFAEHARLPIRGGIDSKVPLGEAARTGGVLVSESFWRRYGLGVGDTLPFPTPGGIVGLKIHAVYNDYSADRGQIHIDRDLYQRLSGPVGVDHFLVTLRSPGDRDPVEAALHALIGDRSFVVERPGEIRERAVRVFDETFAVTLALRAVAVVTSLIGILGTLLLFVQTEESSFAVLRAVGATRKQIHDIVRLAGLVIGVIGTTMGLVIGFVVGLLLIKVIQPQSFGWSLEFQPAPGGLLAILVGIPLLSLLAGVLPAARSARRDPAALLRGE